MKLKNMIKFFGVMLCMVEIVFVFSVLSASAATPKIESIKKNYLFVDTDGAICGVTIEGNIKESYVTLGNYVKYAERSGFIGMRVNGNANINACNVILPRHFTSSGKVYKSFSDWKFQDYIVAKGVRVLVSQHSSTSVTYEKTNNYYEQMSFSIGNANFILQPYQSGKIKMSLGL